MSAATSGGRQRISDTAERVRDALREAPASHRRPDSHGASGGGERGAFAESQRQADSEQRCESADRARQRGGEPLRWRNMRPASFGS